MKTALLVLFVGSSALASPRLLVETRATLVDQLSLLESERPTQKIATHLLIGGGIALTVGGGVLAFAASLYSSANSMSGYGYSAATDQTLAILGSLLLGLVGVVAMVAGAVLLISAGISFLVKLKQQSNSDEQINEARGRLEELDRAQATPLTKRLTRERAPLPAGFVVATF